MVANCPTVPTAVCLLEMVAHYGPSAAALDAENHKSKNNINLKNGHEISFFLTELHHILHARSCIHFLWFPHTPRPPRPLKRSQNFYLLFTLLQLLLFGLTLGGGIWAMVTRPVQGPCASWRWWHIAQRHQARCAYSRCALVVFQAQGRRRQRLKPTTLREGHCNFTILS